MSALAAISLLLTIATQFRAGGLPLGPGELFLLIWLLFALGREARRRGTVMTPAFSRLLIFWALFAFGQCLGTLTAYTIGDRHDTGLFLHDLIAYPLMAAFSCLLAAGPEAEERMHRITVLLVGIGALALLPQLAAAGGLINLPFDPWFGDRFRGWSNNPNQLALLCAALVLMALHLADRATTTGEWVLALASALPPYFVGRLTKTDACTIATLLGVLAFVAAKLRLWAGSRETRSALRPRFAVISAIALPLMLVSLAPLMIATFNPDALAKGMMKNGGKEAAGESALRFELWQEAIDRGLEAGGLGLGPGPHLPIPPSIVAGRHNAVSLNPGNEPQLNGTPDFEAHNTIFDLFAQGGAIASLSFVWLTFAGFAAGFRARMAGLTALLVGLTVFALLDLVVREPIYWFGLVLCLTAGGTPPRPAPSNRRAIVNRYQH